MDKPEKCAEYFKEITAVMCELCLNTGPRKPIIDIALQLWLFCVQNVSAEKKFKRFRQTGIKKL